MLELKFSSIENVLKVELSSGTVPKIEWNGRNCELSSSPALIEMILLNKWHNYAYKNKVFIKSQ